MTYKELGNELKRMGRKTSEFSQMIGVSVNAIYAWRRRDHVPAIYEEQVRDILRIYEKDCVVTVKTVIEKLGGVDWVSTRLGLKKSQIYWWQHTNSIPDEYSKIIKKLGEEVYLKTFKQGG